MKNITAGNITPTNNELNRFSELFALESTSDKDGIVTLNIYSKLNNEDWFDWEVSKEDLFLGTEYDTRMEKLETEDGYEDLLTFEVAEDLYLPLAEINVELEDVVNYFKNVR